MNKCKNTQYQYTKLRKSLKSTQFNCALSWLNAVSEEELTVSL